MRLLKDFNEALLKEKLILDETERPQKCANPIQTTQPSKFILVRMNEKINDFVEQQNVS